MPSWVARVRTVYRQRAIFRPSGLLGQAYWWSLRPFHDIVFGGMLRTIVATAGRASQAAAREENTRRS